MNKKAFQLVPFSLNRGWTRLLIVVYLSWIAIVGLRLFYELDGQTGNMFLAFKTENPADFTDNDLDNLENELRENLKNLDRRNVKSVEDDRFLNSYTLAVKENHQNKQANLRNQLDSLSALPLTDAEILSVAKDLSISEQRVRDLEIDARRYVQLRDLKGMMVESPVLKAQILGVKPITFSIDFLTTFLALFVLPAVAYLFGGLCSWIWQGFRTEA